MPFLRPTIQELKQRIQSDLNYRLPGTDARLRRSNTNVLATVHAGAVHGLYGHQQYLADQINVVKADEIYLPRHAEMWGVPRKAAKFAAGPIAVTGLSGQTVPAGTIWQSQDGIEYKSAADATLVDGTADITVTARTAGAAGNVVEGVTLALLNPIDSVNSAALVAAGGITNGIDAEGIENWRSRILYRIQHPPMGGSQFDYVAWAMEVAGVTRAWCFPLWLGANSVGVSFVLDDQPGGIIPDAAKVAEVAAYIESHPDPVTGKTIGRPVTAVVTVFAPTPKVINPTIQIIPATVAVKSAVETALKGLLRDESQPGATLLKSHLEATISGAAGVTDRILVAPAADVTHDPGEIPVFGAITWQ